MAVREGGEGVVISVRTSKRDGRKWPRVWIDGGHVTLSRLVAFAFQNGRKLSFRGFNAKVGKRWKRAFNVKVFGLRFSWFFFVF